MGIVILRTRNVNMVKNNTSGHLNKRVHFDGDVFMHDKKQKRFDC